MRVRWPPRSVSYLRLEELGIPAARGGKWSAVLRLASLIDASAALAIG